MDLAREERLKKCDIIIDYFEKILSAGNIEKILNLFHIYIYGRTNSIIFYENEERFIKLVKLNETN